MATSGNESTQECKQWGFPIGTLNSNTDEEIKSLYKSLECPVCHEFPGPGPIYSCGENRHMICEKCLPASKRCPVCSTPVSENRCFSAERCIVDFLTPCKYKFEGCPFMLRGKDVREHIQSCLYRPIQCIMSRCKDEVPFKDLFNHLQFVHANKINGVTNSSQHDIEWWIEGDISSTARWPPFFFTCFDNVFIYMCVSTIHGMWEWVWILANEEEAKRFRFEVKMENLDKLLSIQFKGPVHPIRKSMKEVLSSGQVFVTNSKDVRNPYIFRKGRTDKYFWRSEVKIFQGTPPLPTSVPYLVTNDLKKVQAVVVEKGKGNWSYVSDSDEKTANRQLPNDGTGGQVLKALERKFPNEAKELQLQSEFDRQVSNNRTGPQLQKDKDEQQPNRFIQPLANNVKNQQLQNISNETTGRQIPNNVTNIPDQQFSDNPKEIPGREEPYRVKDTTGNGRMGDMNQATVDSEYSLRLDGDGTNSQNFLDSESSEASEIDTSATATQTTVPKKI